MFLGLIFCTVMVAVIFLTGMWRRRIIERTYDEFAEKENSYTMIFEEDCATALLNAGPVLAHFTAEDFLPEAFLVSAPDFSCHPYEVHACDADGSLLESAQGACHLALDFAPQETAALYDRAENLTFTHGKFTAPVATCSEVIDRKNS